MESLRQVSMNKGSLDDWWIAGMVIISKEANVACLGPGEALAFSTALATIFKLACDSKTCKWTSMRK